MATKEKEKPTSEKGKENGVQKVATSQMKTREKGEMLDIEQIAAQMKKKDEGMEVTSEYLSFEEGEVKRVAVIGLHRMQSDNSEEDDGKVECIRVITEDAKIAICAQAIIVSTLRDAALRFQNGDPKTRTLEEFSITLTEKENRGGGKVLNRFSIKQLI